MSQPSEREEAPERVFLKACHPARPNRNCSWDVSKTREDSVEYVRADLFNAQTEQLKQQASLIEDFRHNRIGDELQRVAVDAVEPSEREEAPELNQIRERLNEFKKMTFHGPVPLATTMRIVGYADSLLSLLDSQAPGSDREAERVAMEGIKEGLRQRDERAATRMRERCVSRVKEMRKDWQTEAEARRDPDNPHDYKGSYGLASGAVDACDDIITALESLTLEGKQEQ